ncbi:hypothetical protein PVOR_01545 [Paenibacillus vortex V453]|uniref:TOTE conflict system primase domain-containing protein n=1 Tax=Paenibacillus vortex V453 TaxID=715225 RepID=A0A2R9T2S6_9BACL|nr:hypothetical protein [Paenibacillus vortex]EFU43854.1 hypothetical protein PVOR_01545 [Paenibacillus vortex V453]
MSEQIEQHIQDHKEALLQQLNTLIIGERKRFIEQSGEGEATKYFTAKRAIRDDDVMAHLDGERTVGCFYIGKASKFLCFDIDENNPSIPLQLLQLLKDAGFKSEELHVENSGLKGWHIWLFFEKPVPISRLVTFGRYYIKELGSMGTKIELRPEQIENSRRHQVAIC